MNIEDILSKIELLPFSNERVLLTENLFYIDLWNCMDIMQKKRLLQMLENNLSAMEKRESNEVIFSFIPEIASASLKHKKIRISESKLRFGTDYIKDVNAQFYCAILHEHDHISRFIDTKSDEKSKILDEFRSNFANFLPYGKSISEYVEYRLQPIEYYAHKISEEKTIETFDRLQNKFGKEDMGFKSWYEIVTKASVDRLVSLYNKEYSTSYTYDEIYANILKKISSEHKSL